MNIIKKINVDIFYDFCFFRVNQNQVISSVNDAQKNRNKIFGKLIRHKLNELRKKITTGVNDFDLLCDKKKRR